MYLLPYCCRVQGCYQGAAIDHLSPTVDCCYFDCGSCAELTWRHFVQRNGSGELLHDLPSDRGRAAPVRAIEVCGQYAACASVGGRHPGPADDEVMLHV